MKTKNMTALHSGKSIGRSSLRLGLLLTFALACFALLPTGRAVTPPPDGGYPGNNTAEGDNALFSLTIGNDNTANGSDALFNNTSGQSNTANGFRALVQNTTGNKNTADGNGALAHNTTGSRNIGIGTDGGENLTIGDHNIDIGNQGIPGESGRIRIGNANQTATFIAGISGADAIGGEAVFVNSFGKFGTVNLPSSARFKEDIKPMNKASEAILALTPVTFRYKKELDTQST